MLRILTAIQETRLINRDLFFQISSLIQVIMAIKIWSRHILRKAVLQRNSFTTNHSYLFIWWVFCKFTFAISISFHQRSAWLVRLNHYWKPTCTKDNLSKNVTLLQFPVYEHVTLKTSATSFCSVVIYCIKQLNHNYRLWISTVKLAESPIAAFTIKFSLLHYIYFSIFLTTWCKCNVTTSSVTITLTNFVKGFNCKVLHLYYWLRVALLSLSCPVVKPHCCFSPVTIMSHWTKNV